MTIGDGTVCPHGVHIFNPDGCPKCGRDFLNRQPVQHANGHAKGADDALTKHVRDNFVEKESEL